MKHVVMRYMSTRIKNLPYGCPGFGDIVHSCLLTYNYGQHYGKPATLHIAPHQYNKMKPQTWKQVMDLFPQGQLYLKVHKFYEENDEAFLHHVLQQYPSAKLHYYEKYPGKLQKVLQPSFFVDEYQKSFPQLKPECYDPILINQLLPSKFVTAQFDASSRKRNLTSEQTNLLYDLELGFVRMSYLPLRSISSMSFNLFVLRNNTSSIKRFLFVSVTNSAVSLTSDISGIID